MWCIWCKSNAAENQHECRKYDVCETISNKERKYYYYKKLKTNGQCNTWTMKNTYGMRMQ